MNAYGILGALLLMAGLGSWGAIESGRADKAKADLISLKASYAVAAQQAKDDAAKQEQLDLQNLAQQSTAAVGQATLQAQQAQKQLQAYQVKLAEASKAKDLPHLCAGVPIAPDLIP